MHPLDKPSLDVFLISRFNSEFALMESLYNESFLIDSLFWKVCNV